MKKRMFSLTLAIVMLLSCALLAGCDSKHSTDRKEEEEETQVFTVKNMSITLPEEFWEATYSGYTQAYQSSDTMILCLQEKFTLMAGLEDYTLDQYGQLVLTTNNLTGKATIRHSHGLTWFEYTWTNPELNIEYYYFSTLHKSDDAFWMIQFATVEDMADEMKDSFISWAQSITFA